MTPNSSKIKILFLGAGTRVTHLESFRRYFNVYSTDTLPLAPTRFVTVKTMVTSGFDSVTFQEELMNIVTKEGINVVMPASHHSLKPMDRARTAIEKAGAFPLLSNSQALAISCDKYQTYIFFKGNEIPTPDLVEGFSQRFPLFIRPRKGSGSKNCFRVDNPKELDFFLGYVEDPIVQPYFDSEEYTIDVFSDFEGNVLSIVPRKRIEARDGEIVKGVTVKDKVLMEYARIIAEKLHTIGPICIQCFKTDDTVYFTEINCRFGGGITLSVQAGADIVRSLYRLLSGEKLTYEESWREGLCLTRAYRDFYIRETEL